MHVYFMQTKFRELLKKLTKNNLIVCYVVIQRRYRYTIIIYIAHVMSDLKRLRALVIH